MACPYFYPVARLAADAGPRSAMLPLGDVWTGQCRADETAAPPNHAGPPLPCWLGYARGTCSRFPVNDPGADAIRFAIARADDTSVHLYYVLERDHQPFAFGPLEYSLSARRFLSPPAPPILNRQAEAYVQSYLRRKKEASGS